MKNTQMTFAEAERKTQRKTTKKEIFLQEMERILPWSEIIDAIKPHYYADTTGMPATPIEIMLRMYLVQAWFNLSDEKQRMSFTTAIASENFVA